MRNNKQTELKEVAPIEQISPEQELLQLKAQCFEVGDLIKYYQQMETQLRTRIAQLNQQINAEQETK